MIYLVILRVLMMLVYTHKKFRFQWNKQLTTLIWLDVTNTIAGINLSFDLVHFFQRPDDFDWP